MIHQVHWILKQLQQTYERTLDTQHHVATATEDEL